MPVWKMSGVTTISSLPSMRTNALYPTGVVRPTTRSGSFSPEDVESEMRACCPSPSSP